jgi:hypothetical protein
LINLHRISVFQEGAAISAHGAELPISNVRCYGEFRGQSGLIVLILSFGESVKGFGCRPFAKRCDKHRWPASESLQRRKPRWGNVWQCRVRYVDLTTVGLERAHNFSDMARTLLMGESNFLLPCDFKELRVAKRAHISTSALSARWEPLLRIGPNRYFQNP